PLAIGSGYGLATGQCPLHLLLLDGVKCQVDKCSPVDSHLVENSMQISGLSQNKDSRGVGFDESTHIADEIRRKFKLVCPPLRSKKTTLYGSIVLRDGSRGGSNSTGDSILRACHRHHQDRSNQ